MSFHLSETHSLVWVQGELQCPPCCRVGCPWSNVASPGSLVPCFYVLSSPSLSYRWCYFLPPACKDETILLGEGKGRTILIRLNSKLWPCASTWEALDMQPLAMGSVQTVCKHRHLVVKSSWAVPRNPHGHYKSSL